MKMIAEDGTTMRTRNNKGMKSDDDNDVKKKTRAGGRLRTPNTDDRTKNNDNNNVTKNYDAINANGGNGETIGEEVISEVTY
jgi:hypothetical protein